MESLCEEKCQIKFNEEDLDVLDNIYNFSEDIRLSYFAGNLLNRITDSIKNDIKCLEGQIAKKEEFLRKLQNTRME